MIVAGPTIREIAAGEPYRRPVHRVHSDFTDVSGPGRVRSLLMEGNTKGRIRNRLVSGEEAEVIMRRRYTQYNVWRPMNDPVPREPLGVVDATTIGPDDTIACRTDIGEFLHAVHNPAHRWYYAPDMRPDEVLIFKGYDSAHDGRARFTLHSAFDDPSTPPDAPQRSNIEARVFAFFDQ